MYRLYLYLKLFTTAFDWSRLVIFFFVWMLNAVQNNDYLWEPMDIFDRINFFQCSAWVLILFQSTHKVYTWMLKQSITYFVHNIRQNDCQNSQSKLDQSTLMVIKTDNRKMGKHKIVSKKKKVFISITPESI